MWAYVNTKYTHKQVDVLYTQHTPRCWSAAADVGICKYTHKQMDVLYTQRTLRCWSAAADVGICKYTHKQMDVLYTQRTTRCWSAAANVGICKYTHTQANGRTLYTAYHEVLICCSQMSYRPAVLLKLSSWVSKGNTPASITNSSTPAAHTSTFLPS